MGCGDAKETTMGFGFKYAVEETRGQVVAVKHLREQLVRPGDLRNEIGFQNDINILLAALDDGDVVWNSEAPMLSPDTQIEDHLPPTLTELECLMESTANELWAVPEPMPSPRAA